MAVQFFITNDRPNVAGLVMAGSADFKTELSQSDMFDQRLQAVVLGVVSQGREGVRVYSQLTLRRQSDMFDHLTASLSIEVAASRI